MQKPNKIKFDFIDAISLPLFALTMITEARTLQNRPYLRELGDMDAASEEELSGSDPNHDPLVPVGYEANDTKASLKMLVGNITINTLFSLLLGKVYRALYSNRVFDIRNRKLSFLLAMIGWDFLYYWSHRLQHERRVFWANHVTHHSSEHYNLSTALRQPWSGYLVSWIHMPLPLLGIPPEQVMKAGQLNLLYQYWIHTETIGRLSQPIENLFNTPSHHRVHHGANPQYIDKNYAGVLITWDKIFGTFEPEVRKVKYGLTKNIKTFKPLKIAYHELTDLFSDFRKSEGWKNKISCLLAHPE